MTAALASLAAQVGTETSNASLESRNAEQVEARTRFRAHFGNDEDLLLAVGHPRLLEADGLRFLTGLHRRIAALDGVREIRDLTNAQQILSGDAGSELAALLPLPFDAPEFADRLREALDRNPESTALLLSADRRMAGVLIEIEDRPGETAYRTALIDEIRALMAESGREPGVSLHLTGIAVQKHDVSRFIERDRRWLMPLSVVVLSFVLALFFRSAHGVALPLAVTGVTVASTLGAYRLAGLEVNAITALLPPVLMVLSLAVSVHLVQGWLDAPEAGSDRVARILSVVRRLLFPCFFCTLTTALGFASLLTSEMPAVRQFGAFAAFGVLVSFGVGMTLVPVCLSFLAPPTASRTGPQHLVSMRFLEWSADVSTRRPWRVLAIFLAITALSLGGLPRVKNNTDLVRFLKRDAPLYRDTTLIDARLTGTSALEFVLARRDGTPLVTFDAVARMAAMERSIAAHPEVTHVVSVLAVLRQIERAESGGDALRLPGDERATSAAFDLLEAAPDPALLHKLVTPAFEVARFHVRIHFVGSTVAAPLAETILAEGRQIFGDAFRLDVTGAFYDVAQDSNRLVRSQVSGFSSALLLVFVAIGLLFRSPRLTLVALVPNVMPVAWTGGLMGFCSIDLSTGTAMIASSVIGLVVDDTIHYLARYRSEFRGDVRAAVLATTREVGAPLLVNNLVLVLGFWVGCFGSFKPTIYFSLLSGVTMITALVCDLFVTPACLMVLDRRRRLAQ